MLIEDILRKNMILYITLVIIVIILCFVLWCVINDMIIIDFLKYLKCVKKIIVFFKREEYGVAGIIRGSLNKYNLRMNGHDLFSPEAETVAKQNNIILQDNLPIFANLYNLLLMSYAKYDLTTLRKLLSLNLYIVFENAILDHKKKNHSILCNAIKIINFKIIDFSFSEISNCCTCAVYIQSEQIFYIVNENGKIVDGSNKLINYEDMLLLIKDMGTHNVNSSWIVKQIMRKKE